jgi:hypothetical protein
MSRTINFVLKRIDGTSRSFCADPLATFVEVIGAAPLADSILLRDGHLVNMYLSLAHENITDGSIIVAAQQKRRQRRAKMDLSRRSVCPDAEAARIHDVLWSG